MSYVSLQPKLLFSYSGKQLNLSGSREINGLTQDEIKGWRYIYENCGGARATKRSISSKLQPIIGPLDWDQENLDKPLDLGAFLGEVSKLQTGQRYVALFWAHGQMQGINVQPDSRSVMLSRSPYVPEKNPRSAQLAWAEARAAQMQSEIESSQKLYEATRKANAAEFEILRNAAKYAKQRVNVVPVKSSSFAPPAVGRTPADIAAWRKLFDFIDANETGRVSKAQIQAKLTPLIGGFAWRDSYDATPLTFQEFLDLMNSVQPAEKRISTLYWAKSSACPAKIHPAK